MKSSGLHPVKVMSGKFLASLKSLFNYSQEDKPRYGTFHSVGEDIAHDLIIHNVILCFAKDLASQ